MTVVLPAFRASRTSIQVISSIQTVSSDSMAAELSDRDA